MHEKLCLDLAGIVLSLFLSLIVNVSSIVVVDCLHGVPCFAISIGQDHTGLRT